MQAAAQGFKEVKGNKALNPTSCFPKHCLPYTHKKADSLGFVRKVGSQATVDARHAYHRLKATCQLFIACSDAATFFKPAKATLYRIPLPIFGFIEPPG